MEVFMKIKDDFSLHTQPISPHLKPAVVVSGHTMGLGVSRALGSMGVPVTLIQYDERDTGQESKHVQCVIRAPHPEKSEKQFIEKLVDEAPRFGRGLLIPTCDAALASISRNKEVLDKYYTVAATEWDITKLFLEKKYTYELAEKLGIAIPKTIIPNSIEDVEQYGATVMYPVLVKPSQSHLFTAKFGHKMVEVNDIKSMLEVYQYSVEAGLEVILQEIIPGPDSNGANYNSYFWDNKPLVEFTARKMRSCPPRFGSPRVVLSEIIPEITEPGRKILAAMGFYGFSCTEFKKDFRDGKWKLMEVNGRHNMSCLLAARCGVNFPYLQYRHLVYNEQPSAPRQQTGIYWIDLVRDMGCNIQYFGKEPFGIFDYFRPYINPHIDAIFDWKDPKPFTVRIKNLVKSAASMVLKSVVR
jgi:D-aspartate ligase